MESLFTEIDHVAIAVNDLDAAIADVGTLVAAGGEITLDEPATAG